MIKRLIFLLICVTHNSQGASNRAEAYKYFDSLPDHIEEFIWEPRPVDVSDVDIELSQIVDEALSCKLHENAIPLNSNHVFTLNQKLQKKDYENCLLKINSIKIALHDVSEKIKQLDERKSKGIDKDYDANLYLLQTLEQALLAEFMILYEKRAWYRHWD